jgi:hypothetical protein
MFFEMESVRRPWVPWVLDAVMPGMRARAWERPLGVLGRVASGAMARSWVRRVAVAGPRLMRAGAQKRVERVAERVDAEPHGFGIGDGVNDVGGIQAKNGSRSGGPRDGIREARDVTQVDITHMAERGGNRVGESGQGECSQSFEIGADGSFGARGGDGSEVDGEAASSKRARGGPGGLGFVKRRDQDDGARDFGERFVAIIGLRGFKGRAGREGA